MNNDKPWQWKRVAKDAIRCGDYSVVRETLFGDTDYLAQHAGKVLAVAPNSEAAKGVCYRHASPIPEVDFANVQKGDR